MKTIFILFLFYFPSILSKVDATWIVDNTISGHKVWTHKNNNRSYTISVSDMSHIDWLSTKENFSSLEKAKEKVLNIFSRKKIIFKKKKIYKNDIWQVGELHKNNQRSQFVELFKFDKGRLYSFLYYSETLNLKDNLRVAKSIFNKLIESKNSIKVTKEQIKKFRKFKGRRR